MRSEARVEQRFDEHPLRAAQGSDGVQPALSNPVVDGSPRDVEEMGSLENGDAPAKTLFGERLCVSCWVYTLTSAHLHWQGGCQEIARVVEPP